jgi:SWI/SNF-related matrix-associated actin-dependent regulator of chromatin subfamily A-like protein 1
MPSIREQLHAELYTPPYRFQVQGVRFLNQLGGRGILGFDMGLGKSLTTAAWLKLNLAPRPAVIVCPATLKLGWQRELWKHARLDSEVVDGRTNYQLEGDIWIFNYDIMAAWQEWLVKFGKPKVLVLDELQRCGSKISQRTKACCYVGKRAKHVIGLSGTPIRSRPIEFFPVLNLIAPKVFNSFWEYAFSYCNPKKGFRGQGWDFSGASNLDDLHAKVAPFMLRRTKEEVLPELPKKIRTVIPIKIDMREYNKARDDFVSWLTANKGIDAALSASGAMALVRLENLKQIAAKAKIAAVTDWIQDFCYDQDRPKLVLFAVHKEVIKAYCDKLGPAGLKTPQQKANFAAARLSGTKTKFPNISVVTGDVGMTERQLEVDRFQNNPNVPFFIGNLHAAGVGLTLTAASTVGFLELGWVPTDHDQAEDRVLRIGQKADSINVFYFVAQGTIEEQILDVHESKRNVVGQILEGGQFSVAKMLMSKLLEGKK